MATITQTMRSDATVASFEHRWGWMLALGIVQIIAGAIAIAVPVVASLVAVAVFGAVLILSAIAQLAYAFKIKAWPRSAWYGLGGALYAIAGLLVILYPIGGALTLAVFIAVLLNAEGGLRVIFAAVVRPAAGWSWLTAAGIGSIIVGDERCCGHCRSQPRRQPLNVLWHLERDGPIPGAAHISIRL
jgi:uncharacterized membrane protein HdeD (DUF308 family)